MIRYNTLIRLVISYFTCQAENINQHFIFMHLADTFVQCYSQRIQDTFLPERVFPGISIQEFGQALRASGTHSDTGK